MMKRIAKHSLLALVLAAPLGCGADAVPQGSEDEQVGEAASHWDVESVTNEAKSTHLWLVNRALDILAKHQNVGAEPHALANNLYLDIIQDPTCRGRWQQGLYDADEISPYKDYGWAFHFYDPTTGENYFGDRDSTALTSTLVHQENFLWRSSVGDMFGACYELGLSLHFMTDITQPMHASNYTWMNWPVAFHTDYEEYVMTIQSAHVRADWSGYPTFATKNTVVTSAAVASHALFPSLFALTSCQNENVYLDSYCWKTGSWVNDVTDQILSAAQDWTAKYIWRTLLDLRRPVDVAAYVDRPGALAVDASSVYWIVAGGAIERAPIGSGTVRSKVADGLNQASGLVVDGDSVYWVERGSGTVKKVPKAGGTVTILAQGQNQPSRLVADAGNVYWINQGDSTVMKVAKAGGAPVQVGASVLLGIRDLAIDAGNLYWTIDNAAFGGRIVKQPLSGGPSVTIFAAESAHPDAITVTGNKVFWTDPQAGAVNMVPVSGGLWAPIALAQGPLSGITTGHGYVYWSSRNGTVSKAPAGGGSASVLATQENVPAAIAVGGDGIFWTDEATVANDGEVVVMPDPDAASFL